MSNVGMNWLCIFLPSSAPYVGGQHMQVRTDLQRARIPHTRLQGKAPDILGSSFQLQLGQT